MFARANRLDRTAFSHTYTHGRHIQMPGLTLVYLQAPMLHVAAVVGKKVAKSAVARNLLRRRLYAVLYELQIPSGHIVVIAKPVARNYPYQQLRAEVATALNRLGRVGVQGHSR